MLLVPRPHSESPWKGRRWILIEGRERAIIKNYPGLGLVNLSHLILKTFQ